MDRETILGIIFSVIFYLVHIGIVIVMLNIEALRLMIGFLIVIAVIECLFQEVNWDKRRKVILVWGLIAKDIFICFFLSTISLFIVTTLLIFILSDDTISKSIFNVMVSFTFLATLSFYRLYVMLNLPQILENLITKYKKGKQTLNPTSRNKRYRKEIIHKIDFITICATVFLLGNSTFTTLASESLALKKNPYDSIEFRSLFYLIPIYVQSAYYKLFRN